MAIIDILLLALALAMDAFAVAVSSAAILGKITKRQVARLSWHFGFFQFAMPIIGWYAGGFISHTSEKYGRWLAFIILAFLGIKVLISAIKRKKEEEESYTFRDPTRGWSLIALSTATSIDALACGFTLALLGVKIWLAALIIGIVASAMTALGMFIGKKAGQILGSRAAAAGGLILIGLALKILLNVQL